MRTLLLFVYFAFAVHCYPQAQKFTPKVKLAIETYAFLKGQSSALQMIALQFPTLKHDVAATEKSSEVMFGRAERNIENFLQDELGDSEFRNVKDRIKALLYEQFKNPIQKKKHARDFLEKVRYRLRFTADTSITKSIISFAYHDAPHQEITDGYIRTYSTKSHPKAAKSALKLSIPKSWRAEEAEMSATVQQFTSYDGNGTEKILIVIYDLPAEDPELVLNEMSVAEMIPPETNIIRTETMIIDGKTGIMVEAEETLNLSNNKMKIRMLQFMFAQKQKLYCLQGSIGPAAASKNLGPDLKKYEPLFRLVATGAQLDNR